MNPGVLNVAKINRSLLLLLLLFSAACARPSKEDQAKMRELESIFGDEYVFKFEGEFYIAALAKKDKPPKEIDKDAEEIYEAFMFSNSNSKKFVRPTNYIYLNMFNKEGVFLFQLLYNRRLSKFSKGNRPYY